MRTNRPTIRSATTAGRLLLLVILVVLLAGGLFYGWSYTQSRYYVGVDDANQVAIYQGVPGKIVGLHLSSVYRTTDLHLGELTTSDQELVKQTIPVGSLGDANQAVDKLRIDQVNGSGRADRLPAVAEPIGRPAPERCADPAAVGRLDDATDHSGRQALGTGTAAVVPTPRGSARTPATPTADHRTDDRDAVSVVARRTQPVAKLLGSCLPS